MGFKYNPGFLTDAESIRRFVVREKDLRIVSEVLSSNIDASSNRHVLIVGPRGSGKSTLVRRLVAEVRTVPELSEHWYAIVLGEESYTVTSPGEFWLECVFHLAEQSGESELAALYREMRSETDEVRLRERAVGALLAAASRMKRRFLLVVENLHMIVEDQMGADHVWTIRHALQNIPQLMLLATATKKFDQIQNIDKALFEQFKVHELRPLSLNEVTKMWAALTEEKVRSRRARPVQILTGGSPRLIAILAEFAVGHSFQNLMTRLSSLIDQYTDYFKSQLDSLASAERKIFVTLLEKWDPATTREIAEEARIPVNVASVQLGRLRGRGAVHRQTIDGTQYWEAAERLFNLYYLMRRRGAPSSRVNALVKFMTVYYESDQLYERATDLAKECCAIDPQLRHDHYSALAQIMTSFDPQKRAQLLSMSPPDFAQKFENAASRGIERDEAGSSENAPSERKRLIKLVEDGHVREANELLESGAFKKERDARLWSIVALSNGLKGRDYEKAHQLLDQARRLDAKLALTWHFRGLLFKAEEKYKEAIPEFSTAIERGFEHVEAWISLGDSYIEVGDSKAAESAFRAAVQKFPAAADAWHALGSLLRMKQENLDEAESALRKASELGSDDINHLGALAIFLLEERRDTEQAERLFRELISRSPEDSRAWAYLIRSLAKSRRPLSQIEHEYALAMAIPKLKNSWRVSSAFAEHLDQLHAHKRATDILEQSTRSNPDSDQAWFAFAKSLALQSKKDEQALAAFNRTLELNPNNYAYWVEFGEFLSRHTERDADAETVLRKAIAMNQTNCGAWKALGEHLSKGQRLKESEECFRRAMTVNPRCVCSVEGLSSVLGKGESGIQGIVQMIDGFIRNSPEFYGPHLALAKYLRSLANDKSAASDQLFIALKKGAPPGLVVDQLLDVIDFENTGATMQQLRQWSDLAKNDNEAENLMAWNLYCKGVTGELLAYALELSMGVVSRVPENWACRHTLASVLFAAGRTQDSLVEVRWLADRIGDGSLEEFIGLCVRLARAGQSDGLLEALVSSKGHETVEPLIVALRLNENREPNVAREILEVARDIHKQIVADSLGNVGGEEVVGRGHTLAKKPTLLPVDNS